MKLYVEPPCRPPPPPPPHTHHQVLQSAGAAALKEELAQCRQWYSNRSATPVQRAYAAAVLQSEGGACGGDAEGCGGAAGAVSGLELQAFRAARQNHMETRKQHHMQQELQRVEAAGAPGHDASRAGGSSSSSSLISLSDPPVPVLHLRVSGVVPAGLGPSWGAGEALVKVWRPCEAVQQLDEGSVVLATGLCAGTDGRSSTVDGRGKLLELSSGKKTRWAWRPRPGGSHVHCTTGRCCLLVEGLDMQCAPMKTLLYDGCSYIVAQTLRVVLVGLCFLSTPMLRASPHPPTHPPNHPTRTVGA